MLTQESLETAIWPRVAALAGRLWDDKNLTELELAGGLIGFYEDMLTPLEIEYTPITSYWCQLNYETCFKPNDN